MTHLIRFSLIQELYPHILGDYYLVISVKNLYSGYDKKQILHGIDFEAKNEITAIVGSNGSGKSTLLKSIYGLCDVFSGSICVGDNTITDTPTFAMQSLGIQYMAQISNVFSELTVWENLVIAGIPNSPDTKYLFDFFPTLQDTTAVKAGLLSGGQRQLLAMAMAISKRPRVMLFDEPTANLSPKNADMVLAKIKEIQENLNNCIILVEQNVKNALNISDTCYLFASGSIVYSGSPKKLLSDPNLTSKYLGVDVT